MSIQSIQVDLKWFNFSQNNSGGYFITNDAVAEEVFIQARSAKEALGRAGDIFEDYSEYCDCCGERWSSYVKDEDGTDEPTIMGVNVHEVTAGMYSSEARLHHFDGRVEAIKFKEKSA